MKLAFVLTMPNRGSWNGQWSGQNALYAIVRSWPNTRDNDDKVRRLLAKGSWYHNFGDGWGARVLARSVTPAEVLEIKKNSKGFCGYDWMVDSIIDRGEIKGSCTHGTYLDRECARCADSAMEEMRLINQTQQPDSPLPK